MPSFWTIGLVIYTTVWVCLLFFFLFLIALFYQRKSGQQSHAYLFLLPLPFALLAAWRSVTTHKFAGDLWGDFATFVAGSIAIIAGYILTGRMLGGRP